MELNGNIIIFAYVDEIVLIVILKDSEENDVVKVTEKLIESSHRISLVINENVCKYSEIPSND